MYSNYSNINFQNPSLRDSMSYNNSIKASSNPPYVSTGSSMNPNDERLVAGGFLGPFILGGITGGLLAPAFYGPGYGRPVNNYYAPYPPYYYGPYYR